MAIPNTKEFQAILTSLTIQEPENDYSYKNIVVTKKSIEIDVKKKKHMGDTYYLWYPYDSKISIDALVNKVGKELESVNHYNNEKLSKIILSIYSLLPKNIDKSVYIFNDLVKNIISCDISQWYVLPVNYNQFNLTFGSFKVGNLNHGRLKYRSEKAGSDFYEIYREELIDRLTVERKISKIYTLDYGYVYHDIAESKFDLYYELVSEYFIQLTNILWENFWSVFLDEQEVHIAYNDAFLCPDKLRHMVGSKSIVIFYINSKKYGWVVPKTHITIDFFDMEKRFPDSIEKLKDEFSFVIFEDSETHQTIKSFVKFVSKAKLHYWNYRIDEAFLHYIIALELILNEKTSSTHSVTSRTAILTHKNFSKSYEDHKKKIDKLYDIRSKYVHTGLPIKKSEVESAKKVIQAVLHNLLNLQRQPKSKNNGFIDQWLKNLDYLAAKAKANKTITQDEYFEIGSK